MYVSRQITFSFVGNIKTQKAALTKPPMWKCWCGKTRMGKSAWIKFKNKRGA